MQKWSVSVNEGVHLLVLGGVHGNETAGPAAIEQIIRDFEHSTLQLTSGTLTFISPVNEKAFRENKRFIDKDLNRILIKKENPVLYEEKIANVLAEEIDKCDVLLDLHSMHAPGPVTVFIDFPTNTNEKLAEAFGAEYALLDWPRVYESNKYDFESYDTTRYAFEAGKSGVLLECGQHTDPRAVEVAKQGILRALSHFDMIDIKLPEVSKPTRIFMTALEVKLDEEDVFTKQWAHLESIPKDTIIANRKNGGQVIAHRDCRMILPKHTAKVGEEWFYLGYEKERHL